jgi:hypothetical protein
MWINIVRFINNYQIKWLPADLAFISDTLANGMWASEYHQIFISLGFQPSTVNAAISTLELIRIGILLYQRAIEREAKSSHISPLDPKK